MQDTDVEEFEEFYHNWQQRIEDLRGRQLSPEKCNELGEQMHDGFMALVMAEPASRFTLEVDRKYRSLQSDLDAVLSHAESQYRLEQGKWYQYLPEKIRIEIQNLFGVSI